MTAKFVAATEKQVPTSDKSRTPLAQSGAAKPDLIPPRANPPRITRQPSQIKTVPLPTRSTSQWVS